MWRVDVDSPCKLCLVRAACNNPCMPMKYYVLREIKRVNPGAIAIPDSIFIDSLAIDILNDSNGLIYTYVYCDSGGLEKCSIHIENKCIKLIKIEKWGILA